MRMLLSPACSPHMSESSVPLSRMASKEPSSYCGRLLQTHHNTRRHTCQVLPTWKYAEAACFQLLPRARQGCVVISTWLLSSAARARLSRLSLASPGVCNPVLQLRHVAVHLLHVLDGD